LHKSKEASLLALIVSQQRPTLESIN